MRGLEAGADDFVRKPIDPFELKARVRAIERLKGLHDEVCAQKRELERSQRSTGSP